MARDPMESVRDQLIKIRQGSSFTVADMARHMKITPAMVYAFERRERNFTWARLQRYASILGYVLDVRLRMKPTVSMIGIIPSSDTMPSFTEGIEYTNDRE